MTKLIDTERRLVAFAADVEGYTARARQQAGEFFIIRGGQSRAMIVVLLVHR
jgi:hypothetical protein